MSKYHTFWKRLGAAIIDSLLFLPYIFITTTSTYYYYFIELCYIVILTMYLVYFHGKYGQTLGKRILGIKVFDIDESSLIGYKRAFLREAIWFFLSLFTLVYSFLQNGFESKIQDNAAYQYDLMITILSFCWLAAELLTMLFNRKRRAVHDYIAQSVVLDLDFRQEKYD